MVLFLVRMTNNSRFQAAGSMPEGPIKTALWRSTESRDNEDDLEVPAAITQETSLLTC